MADVTSFENVPWEKGNLVPRSSLTILENEKTLGTRVGNGFPSISNLIRYYAMHSKNVKNAWFNLSIVILPPGYETVHALCVRAMLSVRKSGQELSAKQFPLLRIIF